MVMVSKSNRGFCSAAVGALLALAWLSSGTSLQAQTTSAAVFGTVQDSQGGVLPGATVTLTSRTQANTMEATTDATGRFVFPIVRPDYYRITVAMQGFKTLERTNVRVSANDRFSTGILVLEVGAMTEEISVVGRVSELQAESGERSFTLENEAIVGMASNGREMFQFATLVPGVLSRNNNRNPEAQVSDFTVNGQRPNSNNMTIDGVANIDTGDNGGNMAKTNIDAVAEFKILTNAYQAEYGRATGGQMQVVTKSGTQEFHGSGYWYGRRSGWNANTWTNKRAAAPPPVGSGSLIEPAEASRNDYGYTIGGPVFIPGSFNSDKTKLFFFWSQEFQRRKDPVSSRETRVPTALERQGDFSQSVDNNGDPWPYIRDYTTGLPCGPGDTSGCFADGGVLGRIPQNRLWQPGLNALNIYPEPNFTAGSGINFQSQVPSNAPIRQDLLRLDFQPTDRWRVTGRYMNTKDESLQAYGTTWAGSGSGQLPMPVVHPLPGSNYLVSAVGILNTTTSLEVSVGRARNALTYLLQDESLHRTPAGLTEFPLLYPNAVQDDYIPWFVWRGGRTSNAGEYQTDRGPFVNENITWDILANLTKVSGSHSFKAGVYYQHSYKAQSNFSAFNTRIDFINNNDNPFDSGYGYANAALGVYNTFQQASKFAYPEYVYRNLEFYVQDNWKPNSRLTLDYGVRFYALTPQWDQTLQTSTFLPDQWSASSAPRLYYPVCLGSYPCSGSDQRAMDPALIGAVPPSEGNTVEGRFVGRLVPNSGERFNGAFQAGQGVSDTMYGGNVFKVSPRFGFVYDLSGNNTTIIRGGAGVFYDRPQGNTVFNTINNAPGLLVSTLTWGLLPTVSAGSAAGADPNATVGMQPTTYNFVAPKSYAWNVGIQQKLAHALLVDLAYVGSSNRDLLEYNQINAVPEGAKFAPGNQDPTKAPSSTPGASAYTNDLLRPYPGYGGIQLWQFTGSSNYHALQAALNRRFDNGLMFSVFYVWSKTLTTGNSDWATRLPYSTDAENRAVNYSYSEFDRPHNFVVNFIYQTPEVASGALGYIANDWQISGIYRWSSGQPYGVNWSIGGIGGDNLSGGTDYPVRVLLTCDPGSGHSSDPYRQIDTSCFAPPTVGQIGGSARYFLHRPPINNLDLSISKTIPFGDRVKFEIRLDAFNALNHTQFTGVNSTVSFASLTDPTITNLPYDANGNFVRNNGFGTISGVSAPRTIQLVTRLTF
jgi:hypothetical protein